VIVDAHNDVLLELVPDPGADHSLELVLRRGGDRLFDRYWLPGLEAGGVGVTLRRKVNRVLLAAGSPKMSERIAVITTVTGPGHRQ
jgi:hypothetical protein